MSYAGFVNNERLRNKQWNDTQIYLLKNKFQYLHFVIYTQRAELLLVLLLFNYIFSYT